MKIVNIVTSLMGNKGSVVAIGMRDWMVFCLAYLFMVFGTILLATVVIIQCFLLSILEQVFSVAVGPYQDWESFRIPSALSNRWGWGSIQSQRRSDMKSKSPIWMEGFDHMVTRWKFLNNLTVNWAYGKYRNHYRIVILKHWDGIIRKWKWWNILIKRFKNK